MAISKPFGGIPDRANAIVIKRHRVKAADLLKGNVQPHSIGDLLGFLAEPRFHIGNHIQIR